MPQVLLPTSEILLNKHGPPFVSFGSLFICAIALSVKTDFHTYVLWVKEAQLFALQISFVEQKKNHWMIFPHLSLCPGLHLDPSSMRIFIFRSSKIIRVPGVTNKNTRSLGQFESQINNE